LEKSIALLGEEKERRRKTLSYAPLGRTPPPPAEVPRKNNALRKNRSEGYKAKENRSKGVGLRRSIFDASLSAKGCVGKAMETHENVSKPV
jgi:hypothetical protein